MAPGAATLKVRESARAQSEIRKKIQNLWLISALAANFPFHFPEFLLIIIMSRAHKRGASRSSRVLGAGCDGRKSACDERGYCGRRTGVVLTPWAGAKRAGDDPLVTVTMRSRTP